MENQLVLAFRYTKDAGGFEEIEDITAGQPFYIHVTATGVIAPATEVYISMNLPHNLTGLCNEIKRTCQITEFEGVGKGVIYITKDDWESLQ